MSRRCVIFDVTSKYGNSRNIRGVTVAEFIREKHLTLWLIPRRISQVWSELGCCAPVEAWVRYPALLWKKLHFSSACPGANLGMYLKSLMTVP